MNRDMLEGKWSQLRGEIKSRWGKLTDDRLDELQGNADKLIGVLQEEYGYNKEKAEKELDEFLEKLG